MKNIIHYILVITAMWPVFILLKLFPRKQKLWLFSSSAERFADNSKYLFHYVHCHQKNIDAYWVTDSISLLEELKGQGYKVVKRKSFLGIWLMIRAGSVFYSAYISEINLWLSSGAHRINLWHGLPLKKIEFDIQTGVLGERYNNFFSKESLYARIFKPAPFRTPDVMFAPTEEMVAIFSSAFKIEESNIIRSGSPRTDQFFDSEKFIALQNNVEFNENRDIYVYMPTFRDVGENFFNDKHFDFYKLNQLMERINGDFWIKAHPAAKVESLDLSSFEYIHILPMDTDMYPVLAKSKGLITDYSSIYIDYLLLNKPIYFYCFDLQNYLSTCREMYFDYGDVTPGIKASNFNELIKGLEASEDEYKSTREKLKLRFWGAEYKGGCRAIIESVAQKIK